MEYYFNELSPVEFQRLINAILTAIFGIDYRATPLRGADGGRDGETAPGNPNFEFSITEGQPTIGPNKKRNGRYLFQVKHHRTVDAGLSDVRKTVISEFENELTKNVLTRAGDEAVQYFFLATNVPSSRDALISLDTRRRTLLASKKDIHADIWWQENIVAYLDQYPNIWSSFPSMFAGGKVPFLADLFTDSPAKLPRAVRISLDREYTRDSMIKFRQIELEKDLSKLFVDLDVGIQFLSPPEQERYKMIQRRRLEQVASQDSFVETHNARAYGLRYKQRTDNLVSALGLLLDESDRAPKKIILEGGPGQGKSTITQMTVQIYRQILLKKKDLIPEARWRLPEKIRLPFRIELRNYGELLSKNSDISIEEFIASTIKMNTGGSDVTVDSIHTIVERAPVVLILDGLDEVGSDDLRDQVLSKTLECVDRFEQNLNSDLRVIITTRPPAIAGRRDRLIDFKRLPIAPLSPDRIQAYVNRWLAVQERDKDERERIRSSFERRQNEPHVQALIKNPMQLSVLLHFIRLKGEAFPDRRAELYRDYFQTVIDRDVEKSPEHLKNRELIEALHQVLGYKIHALTEAEQADGTLTRKQLLLLVEEWLKGRGNEPEMARRLFKLGEERLGLIVTLKGEGEDARYGYEIQPIREYFAAAYINNQIKGNAHDVFDAMVRRSYWREVALFLAGLRRPNEKADLVGRARALDNDREFGWRQDGRTITMQLLLEGVYSEPKHVFTDALDFVIDLLDPYKVPVQSAPAETINQIATLVTQGGNDKQVQRIEFLIEEHEYSADEAVLSRLYRVASQVLNEDKVIDLTLKYKGDKPDLIAKVRLIWPIANELDIGKSVVQNKFWAGAPNHIWAEWIWYSVLNGRHVADLPLPEYFHQLLIDQFASNPISMIYSVQAVPTLLKSRSNWAVWKLLNYNRVFLIIENGRSYHINDKQIADFYDSLEANEASYVGLDSHSRQVTADLLCVCKLILQSLIQEKGAVFKLFSDAIPTLEEYLRQAGMIGWLTRRILKSLIDIVSPYRPVDAVINSLASRKSSSNIENEQRFILLSKEVNSFHQSNRSTARFYEIAYEYNHPTHVRLEDNGELLSVVELLADHLLHGKELPIKGMKYGPFSGEIIRPLVELCRNDMKAFLIKLSGMRIMESGFAQPLLTPDMQRILKIARNSDDPQVLSGSLIALSSSKYLRSAGKDLILKMMAGEPVDRDFRQYFFSRHRNQMESTQGDHSDEAEVLLDVALGILQMPEKYSFNIISTAASYLAENFHINMPPLLGGESDLGIQIQR